jgi:hypothetical protein
VNDIVLMMGLSGSYDVYLTKSSRLEILQYLGMGNPEVESLGWDCWTLRKDAFRTLVKVYDSNGDEDFLRFWAGKFGWDYEQLGKESLRTWLCKDAADDAALADPDKPGGPSDYSDPSPVNFEHVKNLMRSNFPEDALDWVDRARWVGPVQVPWERIDKDDIDSWAASKQLDAVNRFAKDIKAGTGHTNPSVLIQDNDSPKAIIIDGHHRALAHHKLGQPVLSYLGQIDPADRQAAEETHAKQVHSGANPMNKSNPLSLA